MRFDVTGSTTMSHSRVVPDRTEPDQPYNAQMVTCPGCGAHLVFYRSEHPFIDASGFESYTFACEECGASLSGVIDPFDDVLLITKSS